MTDDLKHYRAERPWHSGISFLVQAFLAAFGGYAIAILIFSLAKGV